jgi:hypothetical protein
LNAFIAHVGGSSAACTVRHAKTGKKNAGKIFINSP